MSIRQLVFSVVDASHLKSLPSCFIKSNSPTFITFTPKSCIVGIAEKRNVDAVCAADRISPVDEEDGVSLGTMKLPLDTDIARFETLLFQWGNSLCQGANVPLPAPLKIDKIPGGARLGFITIGDGETQVDVYIDCLVIPGADGSAPMFRAIRNGPLKAQPPPGEARIMRSLIDALNKCVQIARISL